MKRLLIILWAATSLATFSTMAQAEDSSRLDKIIASKTLKVCTTGDYKPYTFLKEDGSYEGIDVSMAQSLAKSLDAKVEFVPTTWKTMMADFLDGKCDIAMGGVSISLARQQKAYMSEPTNIDGKIPFVRCDDKDKYVTVEQLNQKDVRAIEPEGGTNEAFVRKNMPQAQVEFFHDNNTIFKNLVENKADVMITDASEAMYQKRFYPTLCPINPDKPLQFLEKAYMLPKNDISWKLYVDEWVKLAKKNGEYHSYAAAWIGQ